MSSLEFHTLPGEPPTIEEGIQTLIEDGKEALKERYSSCEKEIVNHPLKAVAIAAATGYLLHRLPLRAIFITKMRILSALVPPVLLAIGAAKTCEYLQSKVRK